MVIATPLSLAGSRKVISTLSGFRREFPHESPAFAIFSAEDEANVTISRRTILPPSNNSKGSELEITSRSHLMAFMTVIGTSFTQAGFICQNFGTRELHWSAGVAQLVVTLILVILRGWLRRRVGDRPSETLSLTTGFKASHLACHIHRVNKLMMHVGKFHQIASGQILSDGDRRDPYSTLLPFTVKLELSRHSEGDIGDQWKEIQNHHNIPGFKAWLACALVSRALRSQSVLSGFQSGLDVIDDTANGIWNFFLGILDLLDVHLMVGPQSVSLEGRPDQRFHWLGRFAPLF
jgi:hypothetical protein